MKKIWVASILVLVVLFLIWNNWANFSNSAFWSSLSGRILLILIVLAAFLGIGKFLK